MTVSTELHNPDQGHEG